MHDRVHLLQHPLTQVFLTDIRDRDSGRARIRSHVRALSQMLFYQATADLPTDPVQVTTPLTEAPGQRIGLSIGLVPILRAGLGMVDGILDIVSDARVFHIGIFRDEQTLEPVEYYSKLDEHQPVDWVFVLDPMLATGGSASAAITKLKSWGVRECRYLGIFAAPEGVERLATDHPEVPLHLCALDSYLNDRGYIVPGMGDAGDRQFS